MFAGRKKKRAGKLGFASVTLSLAVLIAACLCFSLEASEEVSLDLLVDMSLEELMNVTVYGASRFEQKVTEAPASISIITADEIKKYGYRTLADILRSVRGFYVTNDRNYNYLGVRGFGRPGDYNTRVLTLLDGHRINENISDGVANQPSHIVSLITAKFIF